ncbi:Gfo/Idh/MocA family oxidoreductase [Streptomyces sp. NPDC096057]|uniref:Gfo/Idh/MocA family oxidoreductase n=1 Tax=Streptomyces sp. NPDC096057 TaxID=3155543 RepID=UPI003332AE2D
MTHLAPAGRRPRHGHDRRRPPAQRTRELGRGRRCPDVLTSTTKRSPVAAERWQVDVSVSYPDLDAVLSDDTIDAVHVCTLNHLTAGQAVAALRAGMHVASKRPVAPPRPMARLVVDTAESAVRPGAPCGGCVATTPWSGNCGAASRFGGPILRLATRARTGRTSRTGWLSPYGRSWRVDPEVDSASRTFAGIGSRWLDLVE